MVLEGLIGNDYLRAGLLFFGIFIVLRIFLYLLQIIFVLITSSTKTDLDDLLLKKTSKPLTYLAMVISLLISVSEIGFEEEVGK